MPVTLAVADAVQKPRCHRQNLQHVQVSLTAMHGHVERLQTCKKAKHPHTITS